VGQRPGTWPEKSSSLLNSKLVPTANDPDNVKGRAKLSAAHWKVAILAWYGLSANDPKRTCAVQLRMSALGQ
jgi:hypothetical protein